MTTQNAGLATGMRPEGMLPKFVQNTRQRTHFPSRLQYLLQENSLRPAIMPHSRLHKGCFAKPPEKRVRIQTTLTFTPTGLTFSPKRVPPPPPPRSPAPNRVRRTTHTPYFSTDDRSLTSFLRFPYEIRAAIYHDLLYCETVRYKLCLYTNRLTRADAYFVRKRPYVRHNLFPAILECCRLINDEGSDVLYGENMFDAACSGSNATSWLIVNSWPLAERNLDRIRRVHLGHWATPTTNFCGVTVSKLCQTFPRLRVGKISVHNMETPKWEEFIERSTEVLSGIQKLTIRLEIPWQVRTAGLNRERKIDDDGQLEEVSASERACIEMYEPVVSKNFPTRKLRWKYEAYSSEYGAYCAMTLSWG